MTLRGGGDDALAETHREAVARICGFCLGKQGVVDSADRPGAAADGAVDRDQPERGTGIHIHAFLAGDELMRLPCRSRVTRGTIDGAACNAAPTGLGKDT